jgi:hypothetical protein
MRQLFLIKYPPPSARALGRLQCLSLLDYDSEYDPRARHILAGTRTPPSIRHRLMRLRWRAQ